MSTEVPDGSAARRDLYAEYGEYERQVPRRFIPFVW